MAEAATITRAGGVWPVCSERPHGASEGEGRGNFSRGCRLQRRVATSNAKCKYVHHAITSQHTRGRRAAIEEAATHVSVPGRIRGGEGSHLAIILGAVVLVVVVRDALRRVVRVRAARTDTRQWRQRVRGKGARV